MRKADEGWNTESPGTSDSEGDGGRDLAGPQQPPPMNENQQVCQFNAEEQAASVAHKERRDSEHFL